MASNEKISREISKKVSREISKKVSREVSRKIRAEIRVKIKAEISKKIRLYNLKSNSDYIIRDIDRKANSRSELQKKRYI